MPIGRCLFAELMTTANSDHDVPHLITVCRATASGWSRTLATPFTTHNHPQFKPTAESIWKQYFTSYPFTDAAQYVIARVVGNWRSAIGKRAIEVVTAELNSRVTLADRRGWVAKQLSDVSFLYRDPTARVCEIIPSLVAIDPSFSFLERALSLCKGGSLSTDRASRCPRQRRVRVPSDGYGTRPSGEKVSPFDGRVRDGVTRQREHPSPAVDGHTLVVREASWEPLDHIDAIYMVLTVALSPHPTGITMFDLCGDVWRDITCTMPRDFTRRGRNKRTHTIRNVNKWRNTKISPVDGRNGYDGQVPSVRRFRSTRRRTGGSLCRTKTAVFATGRPVDGRLEALSTEGLPRKGKSQASSFADLSDRLG
ncbi:hypothetical protein C8R45DRAFT_1124429 [Mycena sanguinolenta]|nr:hypothetical protein C8R45DRAFT_1124429 [Mycena sanguinolenta]